MAVRIRNLGIHNMTINSSYSFNVRISGNPNSVSVEGLPDTFYYHWNPNRDRVKIRGTPERIVLNKEFTVKADDQIKSSEYSVYPLLPSFNQNITQKIVKGVPFALPILVDNTHTDVRIEGPWIGLKYRSYNYGFSVYGTIPENANFTADRFEYSVEVENQSGIVNGTIAFIPIELSNVKTYILDGNKIKVYPSISASDTLNLTIQKEKEFNLPSIPGSTANYVGLTNNGTHIYALHSASSRDDDQIVVISPTTQDGQTAGIIRRFGITRTSHYETHDIEDIFYKNGKLYILTADPDASIDNAYFVLEDIEGTDPTRIINLHAQGGGIGIVQDRVAAILFDRSSPRQGNRFRIYPPSYISGETLISESHEVYTTYDAISLSGISSTNNVSMTSINNYAYILSSTLPDRLSTVEVPNPIDRATRLNHITLSPVLTDPRGITAF